MPTDALTVRPTPAPQPLLEKLGLTAEQFAALDVDKMQRLLDFSLQVEAEQSRRAYETAFERAQNRLVAIDVPKLTEGDRGSRYAKTEAICRVLDPILVDEGFTWTFSDADSTLEGHVKIVMRLRHAGHTEPHEYNAPAWDGRGPKGAGVMTPLQASGAVRTYSERRLRMSVFGLHLVEDDTDGAQTDGPITADQAQNIEDALTSVKANRTRFYAVYGIEKVADLPSSVYKAALRMLDAKRA